jgi:hypothetical protein
MKYSCYTKLNDCASFWSWFWYEWHESLRGVHFHYLRVFGCEYELERWVNSD